MGQWLVLHNQQTPLVFALFSYSYPFPSCALLNPLPLSEAFTMCLRYYTPIFIGCTYLVSVDQGEHGRVAEEQVKRHRTALRRRLVPWVREVHKRRDHPALDQIVQTDTKPYQVAERLRAAFTKR